MLCKERIDWDDAVPESILTAWYKFLNLLKEVVEVRVYRFLFNHAKEKVTHSFMVFPTAHNQPIVPLFTFESKLASEFVLHY